MKYDLTKKDNGIYEVSVNVEAKEWEDALNRSYEKGKGKYNIPGFRKGHAPRAVIEKTYGEGAFFNDAIDDIYYQAYTLVLREHEDIQPIDAPKLDLKKLEKSGVEMVLTISCMPEFALAQYKGLTFNKQEVKVEDEQVEEEIKHDLLRASRLVESKAPVKKDDYVTLDFEGFVDGKPFDGGKAENYQLQIGSQTFIDTFEDQLVGLNIGDKKDVNVTFPKEYHEASLAGKPAVFKVEIKNIRERIMPELNEEFVANSTEFDTVDEYKAGVKARLTKQAQDRADIELDNDILDKIIDDTDFVAPECLVEEEYSRQINGMEQQMKYQGISIEDYCKYIGKTEDEFKADIRSHAARNVKGRCVLEKLLKDENIDISKEDIDQKIAEMAKNTGKSVEDFNKQVDNNMVNSIANELLMHKLMEFLHANNEIK